MFERMVEKDRNRHLFFQDLYKREQQKKKARNKKKAKSEAIMTPVPSFEYEPRKVSFTNFAIALQPQRRISSL